MEGSKIKILNDEVIGKIAAGEVVERPASVIKELVENSIDARSDSIEIEVQTAGRSLIRIADNGEGMMPEDVKIACLHHATSKIRDIGDLERITTLGFRGEALSSISAVSQMDISTCSKFSETGVSLYLESGEVLKMRPSSRIQGTTVEVRNLFYNVPARRKFLKKESTELAEIVNVVGRFIIAHPGIEFKLQHGDRCLLHAVKGMEEAERMKLVLGVDIADHMVAVSSSVADCKITGYVSRPSSTRKDRRAQIFFVNGRFVRNKVLSDVVFASYRSLLERGRYPAAVLFLTVSPEEIDVNVHPTKLEIKFENEKEIKTLVKTAISDSFERVKCYGSDRPEAKGSFAENIKTSEENVLTKSSETQPEFTYNLHDEFVRRRLHRDKLSAASAWKEPVFSKAGDIFQLGKCYIVQLKPESIKVVDQHAAHERVLYEFFSRVLESGPVESQKLLFPIRIDLAAREYVIMEKVIQNFKALGFCIELFGDKCFIVHTVPAVLKDRDVKTVIYDILTDLSSYDLSKGDVAGEFIKLTSCRAAIKSGDNLSREEMVSLMEQLTKCELPFTCPHGRPTMFEITLDELEKRFRRK